MNKIILSLLALFIANTPLSADECQSLYIGGFGGVNFLMAPKDNTGITGGLSLGYKFPYYLRLEVEAAARYNNIHLPPDKFKKQTYSVMSNIYFDIQTNYAWTPYIGAGCGYAYSKNERRYPPPFGQPFGFIYGGMQNYCEIAHNFCYQGIAGVEREAWENTRLGFEYRCFCIENQVRDHSALVTLKRFF